MAEEAPAWGKIAPIFANIFTVTINPYIVRISFGEGFGPDTAPAYHAAITMLLNDAEILAKSILSTVEAARTQTVGPQKPKDG